MFLYPYNTEKKRTGVNFVWRKCYSEEKRNEDRYGYSFICFSDDGDGRYDRICGIRDDPCLLSEEKLAIILGTEGEGLEEETIDRCDYTVKIPMAAGVDSLNVAAASAVAFWELGRKGGNRE